MTDAGMRLDRAGGGAASGEGERLPGRLSLFSFFYKRKRILTAIQKAVADRQLHGKKQQEQRNISAADGEIHERKIRIERCAAETSGAET